MHLPLRSDGPAPRWPGPVDAALEWWAASPGRVRAALRGAAAVVVLAAVTGRIATGPWGPPVDVLVLTRDVTAGAPVAAAAVTTAARPSGLVPDDALSDLDGLPDGAVADGHLSAGSILTHRGLAVGGPGGGAPEGTAVVPVPAAELPPLPVGTRVDVAVAELGGGARVVASSAVVVADDGTWRWLQVERAAVADVASGVRDASLVIAVLPPARGGGP